MKSLSRVQLFATPWAVGVYYAPLSMGFSRQEFWSGLPFPSPENLPDPGTEPESPALQMGSLPLSHREAPGHCVPALIVPRRDIRQPGAAPMSES